MLHDVARRERARHLVESGMPLRQVSREVDIPRSTLRNWFGPIDPDAVIRNVPENGCTGSALLLTLGLPSERWDDLLEVLQALADRECVECRDDSCWWRREPLGRLYAEGVWTPHLPGLAPLDDWVNAA